MGPCISSSSHGLGPCRIVKEYAARLLPPRLKPYPGASEIAFRPREGGSDDCNPQHPPREEEQKGDYNPMNRHALSPWPLSASELGVRPGVRQEAVRCCSACPWQGPPSAVRGGQGHPPDPRPRRSPPRLR